MDNDNLFCVYNLDRGVSLNSKVSLADCANQPLKILRIIVSGIALDAESGLWLKPLYGAPAVPRIFPFDLLYLDKHLRVLEAVEVFPGVELPACPQDAESALLLPQKVLHITATSRGDRLLVCPLHEIDHELSRIGSSESLAVAMTVEGVATPEAVLPKLAAAHEEVPVLSSSDSGNGRARGERVEGQDSAQPGNGSGISESKKSPQGGEGCEPRSRATDIADEVKTPSIAITEVIIEKPSGASPLRAPVHHDPGDLFENWVDSPAVPPAWITRQPAAKPSERESETALPVEGARTDITANPAQEHGLGANSEMAKNSADALNSTATPVRSSSESDAELDKKRSAARPGSRHLSAEKPSVPAPSQPTGAALRGVPQPSPSTTFNVAQFGMWQVSPPTAVSPIVSARGAAAENPGNAVLQEAAQPVPLQRVEAFRPADAKTGDALRASVVSSRPDANRISDAEGSQILVPRKPTEPESAKDISLVAVGAEEKGASGSSAASAAEGELSPLQDEAWIPRSTAKNQNQVQQKTQAALPSSDSEDKQSQSQSGTASNGRKRVETKQPGPAQHAANHSESREVGAKSQNLLPTAAPLPGSLKPDQKGKPAIPVERTGSNGKKDGDSHGLKARFKRWLHPVTPPSDRRRAHRRYVPGVIAHYYTGGAPKPFEVADISMTGFYLLTADRWMPGTMIQMTLQKPCALGERKQSITVLSRIVRRGSDGVGAEFVMPESIDSRSHDVQPAQPTDRFALARFL